MTPPVQKYTLIPESSEKSDNTLQCMQSLQLSALRSSPLYLSKSLEYSYDDGRSGSYLYSQWGESPVIMIEKMQLLSLERNSVFHVIIPASSLAKSAYRLESDLHIFHHAIHSNETSQGVMEISNRLIDMKTKNAIASKRFAFSIPSKSNNAKGGVDALNQASNEYVRSLTHWINESMEGKCK